MKSVAESVWTLRYPLPLLGNDLGRTVTIIRLESGKLVIHSTGAFTDSDVAAISKLGDPGWLLDATLFHDSFAKEGRAAFPNIPYLAPRHFDSVADVQSLALSPPPAEWADELDVVPLAGMPKVQEHVMFHRPSCTLIVCDCLFNLGASGPVWTRFFTRYFMGLRNGVGMSLFFRLMIKDRAAFKESIRPVLDWDFQRIVVGHGNPLAHNTKGLLLEQLRAHGLLPI